MGTTRKNYMKSDTNMSRRMIDDHEKVRQIARDFYVYGCYPIEKYVSLRGISTSKYNKVKALLKDYMGEDSFLSERREGKKKISYCRYAVHDNWENTLAETFRNHKYGNSDLVAFIQVQQILAQGRKTVQEIMDEIPDENSGTLGEANLRNRLKNLEEWGYIHQEMEGRTRYYVLDEDLLENFTEEEMVALSDYLRFLKNVSPLEMPYYYLDRKLRLYLQVERDYDLYDDVLFQFKHNHLFVVLDNDVLLALLKAKKAGTPVLIHNDLGERQRSAEVIVHELIHDTISGRQYALCESTDTHNLFNARLDRIMLSRTGKGLPQSGETKRTAGKPGSMDINQRKARVEKYVKSCWCVSSTEHTEEVVIDFLFDEKEEWYIQNRIIREGNGGKITRLEEGHYEYKIEVFDPKEMVPWIRSFGEKAVVRSPKWLRKRFQKDWKEALNAYENL